MVDSWEHTRTSLQRLRNGLRDADEDTQWNFGFWVSGNTIMIAAIIGQFGWWGLCFCFGALLWAVGNIGLSRQ